MRFLGYERTVTVGEAVRLSGAIIDGYALSVDAPAPRPIEATGALTPWPSLNLLGCARHLKSSQVN